ncbi:MAG TPA: hypothetical protein VGM74_03860 [Burkholderiaceae bacterium]|jgi:hypothetical protein
MTNALFGFEDKASGERAAAVLREASPPTTAVDVHANESVTRHATARQVDEQVTGGLVTNLLELFQGVFEWGPSPHPDASAFEETLRRGGVVVSVTLQDEAERPRVDSLMQATGFDRRTEWREPGRSDVAP